tara:strand:+ start:2019 stop:2471 length:453 start_codon:yes stop_codon:yes gene_type:complete
MTNNNLNETDLKRLSNGILDKDDFNIINHLLDQEYSRLISFQDELKRAYKPYENWGNKFRTNIQNRFNLLISEIEAERNQCERIQDNIRTIKNDYVKYFWKYPHEIVMEELTDKQREQCDIFNYETTNKFKEIVLDRINRVKPDETKVND